MAEEIKLRAERRAGEILKKQVREKGEYPRKQMSQAMTFAPTLSEMDIERNQSSNWQLIASIPEDIFEDYIQTSKEITTAGAVNIAKKIQRENEINEIKKNISNISIDDLYDVIVIDPPWEYTTEYNPDTRRISSPYPEMSLQEIKDINIPAKDDCILWLWTTHKFIWEANEILEYWGFNYKAILIWDKEKMGIGYWLRLQCEFCLLGIKGNPIWDIKNMRDIIREARKEHSRKPESFYKMIDDNFRGSKLDYFGREQRKGWRIYGAEIKRF
jgi:N6-adenosine-specific RNA methylase IME4